MRRVAVIGAGYAGLATADALARGGAEVTVLEAADRVGGRVWSERLPGGGLIERGGEFITSGYDATEELAGRLGLELDGMGIRYPDRELVPDQGLDREELLAAAERVVAAALAAGRAPAPEVLAQAVSDPRARELFASRIQSAVAYPFERLDARWLTKAPSLLEAHETRRVRGGNQLLASRLGEALPRPPALGARVRAVRHGGAGVTVILDDGEIAADACVVAVPCGLVTAIDFQPGLPDGLAAELDAIPMSSAAKLAVELRSARAPRALMSVPGRYWAWTTPCDEVGGRVLGSWAGSAPVLADLGVGDGDPAVWLERLRELWPSVEPEAPTALLTVWGADAWPGGAYSVLRNDEPGPVDAGSPRIAFAGEYTAAEWSGTMEGALRSGIRAADHVLRALDGP